ncbi:MAG: DUF2891 domain-containing protein [Acidobacteriota bacterium]
MTKKVIIYSIMFLFLLSGGDILTAVDNSVKLPELNKPLAIKFANMALKCIEKEYPNKPSHVINDNNDIKGPRDLHPAFYGCFDWHSSVHGHWMLVKLLKVFPDLKLGTRIRSALKRNITKKNIEKELIYFNQANRKSFERTYGWAWLLKLTEELYTWKDSDGKILYSYLKPLAEKISDNYINFLPKQTYPIRTGVHPNTAFGLLFAYDYAGTIKNSALLALVKKRSMEYFSSDKNSPHEWEPGGEDFFSPSLMEADLMTRILTKEDFRLWFAKFLPGLKNSPLLKPAIVSDRSDGKLSHLDGLNLSRAWCMADILKQLPESDKRIEILKRSIKIHMKATIDNIKSGFYAGEHWLGSFAVYTFSRL